MLDTLFFLYHRGPRPASLFRGFSGYLSRQPSAGRKPIFNQIFPLTKKTTFVRLFSNLEKMVSGSIFCYLLLEPSGEGKFLCYLFKFRKTSVKRKEVKGSEEDDEHGLSISGFSGIYLWLRRDGKQRAKS
jgi:hypothetical protein